MENSDGSVSRKGNSSTAFDSEMVNYRSDSNEKLRIRMQNAYKTLIENNEDPEISRDLLVKTIEKQLEAESKKLEEALEKERQLRRESEVKLKDVNSYYESLTKKLEVVNIELNAKKEEIRSGLEKPTDCCHGGIDAKDNSEVANEDQDDVSVKGVDSVEISEVKQEKLNDSSTVTPSKSTRQRGTPVHLSEYLSPMENAYLAANRKMKKDFSCKTCGQMFRKEKKLKLHKKSHKTLQLNTDCSGVGASKDMPSVSHTT